MSTREQLELLSPARNSEIGIEAINHGADAVYIGGPAFGARSSADNSVADIGKLVSHAHRFDARIYVTLNTILSDSELEPARQLIWQLYDSGVDALIIQDMGLLELDLPPLQLHASTQCDIRSVATATFLDQVGFSQLVLARELDLPSIRAIAAATSANLEFFVHGALCVAYSGQCYISHAQSGRSANRGECSQACRLPYTLADEQGRILANQQYLLSMKDNDQSSNLGALIEAGISSFKIEGRYKDLAYVKNSTAFYRQLLDNYLDSHPGYRRLASGRCHYRFTPQPEKTFNRSATDYFVNGRQPDIAASTTPKYAGEAIGTVTKVGKDFFDYQGEVTLVNGDGLSYFNNRKDLMGLRVNRCDKRRIYPDTMPDDLFRGAKLHRNRDHAFIRLLEKPSAERLIPLKITFTEGDDGFTLTLCDERNSCASVTERLDKALAQQPEKSEAALKSQLGRLGGSDFVAAEVTITTAAAWFIPASQLNALRRRGVEKLIQTRLNGYQRPPRRAAQLPAPRYPTSSLTYLANIYNQKAAAFYRKHGVTLQEPAYEANQRRDEVALMIPKHGLRYSFSLCPKQAKGVVGVQGTVTAAPLTLTHGNERLTLAFDCQKCEMLVMGRLHR
ncbi:MAG: U32 family peptidase [Gammaproteobacteria bacterium]|nr:U32 family peptidase [Gammaproteobacteria bacterium]